MSQNPFTTTHLPASRASYDRAVLAGVVAFIVLAAISAHLLTPTVAQPTAPVDPIIMIATARPPAIAVAPPDHAPAAHAPVPTLVPTIAPTDIPALAPAPAPVEAPAPIEPAPAVEAAPAPAPVAPTPYPVMTAQPAICETGCNGGVGPVKVAPLAPPAAEFTAPDPRARCQFIGCLPGR